MGELLGHYGLCGASSQMLKIITGSSGMEIRIWDTSSLISCVSWSTRTSDPSFAHFSVDVLATGGRRHSACLRSGVHVQGAFQICENPSQIERSLRRPSRFCDRGSLRARNSSVATPPGFSSSGRIAGSSCDGAKRTRNGCGKLRSMRQRLSAAAMIVQSTSRISLLARLSIG